MLAYQELNEQRPLIHNNSPIEKIAILVAMPEEARPIIDALNLKAHDAGFNPCLNFQTYQGKVQDKMIYLVVNGIDTRHRVAQVGTDAATLCAYETIRLIKPDTIISAGTAGGYAEKGACIGDIYIGTGSYSYHDRRIPVNRDYEAYSKGHYACLEAPAMVAFLNLKLGIISTGNSLTLSKDEQMVINANGAIVKEMEVAAIASVAQRFGVRIMAAKAITNLANVNANVAEEFARNFTLATHNLASVLPKIINYILGKTPKQLQTPLSLVSQNYYPTVDTAVYA